MNAPPQPKRSGSGSGTRPRVPRVLVIDDEHLLADVLSRLLSDEFDVKTTTDPVQALAWLSLGEWYDVILCDVVMPVMNGVELLHRIEEVRPDLAPRIVFLTGGAPWAYGLLAAVPNTVIEKPVELDTLRELIRRRSRTPTLRAAAT